MQYKEAINFFLNKGCLKSQDGESSNLQKVHLWIGMLNALLLLKSFNKAFSIIIKFLMIYLDIDIKKKQNVKCLQFFYNLMAMKIKIN